MLGIYQKDYPRIQVGRNWDPQNPTEPTVALPISTAIADPSQAAPILSGMIISPNADGTAWKVGVDNGESPALIAFAQDSVTDFDVVEANSLVGLPCSSNFRLKTNFFLMRSTANGAAVQYKPGTKLTYCKNNEDNYWVKRDGTTWNRTGKGCVRPAQQGEPVIGIVASVPTGGVLETSGKLMETGNTLGVSAGIFDLQPSFDRAVDSTSVRDNAYYLELVTTWSPDVTMA